MSCSKKRRRDEHSAKKCTCPVHVARREYQRKWWHIKQARVMAQAEASLKKMGYL